MVKRIMNIRNITYKNAILYLVTFFVSIRLLAFIITFGEKTLQLDFTSFYTAGESLNANLSPYKNYLAINPNIWDGFAKYKHSRFLYPPLAAEFFRPIALFPYHIAKYLWMGLSIGALLASIFLSFKVLDIKLNLNTTILAILMLFIFHPLLKLLAFGQIDAITLFLLTLGIYLMLHREVNENEIKWRKWIAGILFSLATLFKPHIIFILPFLIIRKKWKTLGGYAIGSFIMLIITGYSAIVTFAETDLPRIATYLEYGTEEMKLPNADSLIASIQPAKGFTIKDGNVYLLSKRDFEWSGNATLTRTYIGMLLQSLLSKLGFPISLVIVSTILFIAFFILISALNFRGKFKLTQEKEFLFWQFVLVIILLIAPITWVTNTIWVITLFPLVIYSINNVKTYPQNLILVIISFGLLLMAIPDTEAFPLLIPLRVTNEIFDYKYIIGELFIFSGLLIYLVSKEKIVEY